VRQVSHVRDDSAPVGHLFRYSAWSRALEAAAVFGIALAARLMQIGSVPHKDELNHILAASALLERGSLEIVPGAPYTRAWGFTYLVAGLFRLFGEGLVVARMPAVITGAILVLLLFLWVRSEAGRAGAWLAALLLAFVPISLQLSQWVRFYTPHALLFMAACLLVYRLVTHPPSRPWPLVGLLGTVCALIVMGFHLQPVTAIGLGGLGLWAVLVGAPRLAGRVTERRQRLFLLSGALIGAGIVAAWVAFSSYGQDLFYLATHSPLWAERSVDDVRFYHQIYLQRYGPLWTLFPLASLLALAGRPRAALLAVCIFSVAFVTHSLLPWKAERYLFYALPFFFAIWGIAVGASLPWVVGQITRLLNMTPARRLPHRAQSGIVSAVLAGAVAFAAIGTPAVSYGHKMLTVPDHEWQFTWGTYRGEPDWQAAVRRLQPLIEESEVVLGSSDVAATYALGSFDYLLRRSRGSQGDRPDFDIRPKTLTPLVSTPTGVATVMECHRSGVALIERGHWRNPRLVTPQVVDFLEANTSRVPLPDGWRMVAYHWTSSGTTIDPEACSMLQPSRIP
jgi:hypothetical protein